MAFDASQQRAFTRLIKLMALDFGFTENAITDDIGALIGASVAVTGLATVAPVAEAPVAAVGTSTLAARQDHVHQADASAFRFAVFTGVDSSGGASHVSIASLKINDQVVALVNLTDDTDGTSKYEATVTVNGQLQQPQASGNLSAKKFALIVVAKS
jgi:hypothetical protein